MFTADSSDRLAAINQGLLSRRTQDGTVGTGSRF